MKKLSLFLITVFLVINFAISQNSGVGINTSGTPADKSAMLDVSSNSLGVLIPRMTTAERNAIVSPAPSLMIFNTSTNCFEFFMGTWQTIACSACTIAPAAPASITGPASVCTGTLGNVFSVPVVNGATSYTWTVPTGSFVQAGQGTTSVSVMFGTTSGDVSVTANNPCGSSPAIKIAVTVSPLPSNPDVISGATSVCANSPDNIYSIPAVNGATSYIWSIPTGCAITAGQGTNSITVTAGSTSGNISVIASNSCGTSTSSTIALIANTVPETPGPITGLTTLCSGQKNVVFSINPVPGASTYTWSVPAGANITAGSGTTSITVTFGVNSGNVGVTAGNNCGNSPSSILTTTITSSSPATPGNITGLTGPCSGQSGVVYSITPVPGATSYTWSTPPGGSITDGQGTPTVTITFGNVSGNISVSATNGCGTSTIKTLAITIINAPPATPGAITGPIIVCALKTGLVYYIGAVTGATAYTWSVPTDAAISAGQGTTAITVTMGSNVGSIGVTANNACGISPANSVKVTISDAVPATPGPISGDSNPCATAGNVYSIDSVPGATSYLWAVPSGSSITGGQGTTSITVTFANNSGQMTVAAVNGCGTSSVSTMSITINSAPGTPGSITGTTGPCAGQLGVVYSVSPVPGATFYSWTVPPGSVITAGQGTTSITVTFGSTSGTIAVTADNNCGNSIAQSLVATVLSTPPSTPDPIIGFPSVATDQAGVVYFVPVVSGAASYVWTVTGGTITSGQGTNSITVTWGNTAGTFDPGVSVYTTNGCGSSTPQNLKIIIYKTPTGNYQDFACTGTEQSFVVPAGVTKILIITHGAAGGSYIGSSNGPAGGCEVGTATVTPGQVLTIITGSVGITQEGSSGFNGGSGGGGYSGVLDITYKHIVSAGGGGGYGSTAGGLGGGGDATGPNGGLGGVNSGGPVGGSGGIACPGGNNGFLGTFLAGGNGGNKAAGFSGAGGGGGYGPAKGLSGASSFIAGNGGFGGGGGAGGVNIAGGNCSQVAAGGGGGGYTGGNGGNLSSGAQAGGGGGGSNYVNTGIVTELQNTKGGANNTARNGIVVIGW